MPTLSLPLTAVLISTRSPSKKYGIITPMRMERDTPWSAALLIASVAKIPRGATVTSATLKQWGAGTFTGTVTLGVRQITGSWTSSATWTSRPGFASTALATQTKTSPVPGAMWTFDLAALVQSWVSGTAPNYGVQITNDGGPTLQLRGSKAADAPPVLEITYTMAPAAPTGLNPSSGAVADAKPTLSWDADADVIQAQVQIDGPPGDSTPEWDSGAFATVGGLLDLAATTFPGLADGAVKVWRVRQRNGNGWSAWSSWATVARISKPVGSLLAPGATVYDPTPPFQWSLASGTQVAWRARLLDATGRVLSDSGKVAGSATAWTPPRGFTVGGQSGTAVVDIWDDVDRASGPGAPVMITVSRAVTFVFDAATTSVASVAASQDGVSPVVVLAGTRDAGIPDEVAVFRNGVQVGRYAGTDAFSGNNFTINDHTAPMSTPATYRVAAVVNGKMASGGPTITLTPTCQGIWLLDDVDPTRAVAIWGNGDQGQSSPETAITHVPISSDGPLEVVRRRIIRLPMQGTIEGTLVDALGVSALDSEALLREFIADDAGHLYRLVLGRQNLRVIVGDVELPEQPIDSEDERVLGVSFSWWARAV